MPVEKGVEPEAALFGAGDFFARLDNADGPEAFAEFTHGKFNGYRGVLGIGSVEFAVVLGEHHLRSCDRLTPTSILH